MCQRPERALFPTELAGCLGERQRGGNCPLTQNIYLYLPYVYRGCHGLEHGERHGHGVCEYVSGEMGFSASGEARIGMWSGATTRWEMEQLAEQFEEFDVPHRFSTEFDDENADWNGEWLEEALAFLAADM